MLKRERPALCQRCGEPVPDDRHIVIAYRDGYYCSAACRDTVLAEREEADG